MIMAHGRHLLLVADVRDWRTFVLRAPFQYGTGRKP